ncbi:13572_t:CDS:1, partial [Gigaspora rosea]
ANDLLEKGRNSQYPIILENLFSDKEENLAKNLLDLQYEE